MRKRDWADEIAEKFQIILESADGEDFETIKHQIGRELRRAYFTGLREVPIIVKRDDKQGKVSRYQICLPVDAGSHLTKEYIDTHGRFTYLADEDRHMLEMNPDDPSSG